MLIFLKKKMVELFANIGDPDQTPRSATSDLGLQCLPQWIKDDLEVVGRNKVSSKCFCSDSNFNVIN